MEVISRIVNHIENDEVDQAYELIRASEGTMAQNPDFISAKAMLCIKVGEYRTAVNLLKIVLKLDPENADACFNLCYAYEMLDGQSQIGFGEQDGVVVKDLPKRIAHTKGTTMPTRAQSEATTFENGAPLVSIVLLAYNNLDYTKLCVESIYKYTNDVDYELITVDNGSSDDTFAYFKCLPKRRIVRLTENQGAAIGFNEGMRIARGRYIACVCNDFIFSQNWLSNLVRCMESDERIGFVSPGAGNISNMQQIPLQFSNVEEMQAQAAAYNVSDPTKWEERVRLLPCVLFVRREVTDIVGYYDPAFYYGEFADDDLSFRIRRNGYKLVYCGDTFTYHFGSVTTGAAQSESKSLEISRELFIRKHGIDVWHGVKYDINLLALIDPAKQSKAKTIRILAVDPRCGNTLVMAKNRLGKAGITDVELYAFAQNPMYYIDLKSVCTDVKIADLSKLRDVYSGVTFDYVILDEPLDTYAGAEALCADAIALLAAGGTFITSVTNNQSVLSPQSKAGATNGITPEALLRWIADSGIHAESMVQETLNLNQDALQRVNEAACLVAPKDREALRLKLMTGRYLIRATKVRAE